MLNPVRVVVLAGGFGGARMAHGFALLGDTVRLSVIVNTGDDLELHRLHISPDLDTVMYTLAGLANDATGWGVRDETWSAAEMLGRYGEPTWFRLGDRDLATHVTRTRRLAEGDRLTDVTADLARALDIDASILPMSDDQVRTKVQTASGWLDFQDYFVRRGHADEVLDVRFDGIDGAATTPEVAETIESADLVVIAPSNPFVSVAPILALTSLLSQLQEHAAPVIAVSPIVAGTAVRGPAADMLRARHLDASPVGIARHYAEAYPGLVNVLVIDERDAALADDVAATGMRAHVAPTLIAGDGERRRLALEILGLAGAASIRS